MNVSFFDARTFVIQEREDMALQEEPQQITVFYVLWLIFSGISIFFGIKYGHSILGGLSGLAIGGVCGAAVGYLIGWVLPMFLISWLKGTRK
jgi:hypothetical protein